MKNMMDRETELWLRPYTSVRQPRVRLICFPHAGGAASAFRTWPQHLPDDVELLAACYPGRENRLGEPPIDQMDVLVERFAQAILPLLDRPVALFGHSMGASVAHELAIRLDERPEARVVGLLISARCPPSLLRRPDHERFPDEQSLIDELRRLGHDNLDLYDDPEFRDLIVPAAWADYRLVGSYHPLSRDRVISAPVTAYSGDQDPEVSVEDMRGWLTATSSSFDLRVFPGSHFYLRAQEPRLVEDIASRLRTPGLIR
jgi:pyochelin biosynthesis protein PchC